MFVTPSTNAIAAIDRSRVDSPRKIRDGYPAAVRRPMPEPLAERLGSDLRDARARLPATLPMPVPDDLRALLDLRRA